MAERQRGRLFGRRQGHGLRAGQQSVLDTRLPRLLAPIEGMVVPPREASWLEIGFGAGEHLLRQLAGHPEIGFIGAEPFINGMAAFLTRLQPGDEARVMLWDRDAQDLLIRLKPHSLERVFVLYPDPWPKKRHWKRRFVCQETLMALHQSLRPGGCVRLATDWADYARWILIEMARHGGFEWLAERASDWRDAPPDHVPTRYEAKALAQGRRPIYLDFRRL